MRYHVHGISRTTGKETTLLVDAKHHEAAEAIAQRQLIVSRVVPEGGLSEPEEFDPRTLDEPAVPPRVTSAPPQPRSPRHSILGMVFIICVVLLLGTLVVLFIRRHT